MMSGAATLFYAFVGFDAVAMAGEESSKPANHVPLAIALTLVVSLISYIGVSAVLTLMVPWTTLIGSAALPDAFQQVRLITVILFSSEFPT